MHNYSRIFHTVFPEGQFILEIERQQIKEGAVKYLTAITQSAVQLARKAAAAAGDKKARDVVILDMTALSPVTDYFVICSGNTTTQVKAIADGVEDALAEQGILPLHKEGYRAARWVLLDYGSFVVHIFTTEDRQFYSLEQLWGEARIERMQDDL